MAYPYDPELFTNYYSAKIAIQYFVGVICLGLLNVDRLMGIDLSPMQGNKVCIRYDFCGLW